MKKFSGSVKGIVGAGVISTLLIGAVPISGQELVSVSDITGGSSVFVFRSGSKAAPRKVFRPRPTRTKTQRIETAKKLSKQYVTLAKVTPRRARTKAVDPNDPRMQKIKTMPADQASRLFAGVGEYYMDRDDFNNAIDFFREAVSLDKTYVVARNGLSEALALKGNEELVRDARGPARAFFEEALTYNPNNAPAHFGLGEVFSSEEKDSEARTAYEKALANDKELTEIYVPLGILYYRAGEIAKADELLTKALAISPNDPETQYFLGLVRYSQNRNNDALTAFRKATAADPAYAEAYYQAGETLLRLNKPAEAAIEFKKATQLKPTFEAWLGLGNAQYEANNWAEAVTAYKEATRLKNNNAEAFENLADAYRQIPDYQQAESNYKLAALFIERTPDFNKEQAADIYSKSAFMIAKQCELNRARNVSKCRWADAISYLEKAAKHSPDGVDSANLGWAYYNAAREDLSYRNDAAARPNLEKARAALQKAGSGNNKYSAGPLLNLGRVLADLGDYSGAVDAYNKAIQKDPDFLGGLAFNELGAAYRKQNKFKEAAAAFRRAAEKEEKNPVIQFNLGEAELQNGNIGEAKKAYERLKKLGRAGNDFAVRLDQLSGGRVRG